MPPPQLRPTQAASAPPQRPEPSPCRCRHNCARRARTRAPRPAPPGSRPRRRPQARRPAGSRARPGPARSAARPRSGSRPAHSRCRCRSRSGTSAPRAAHSVSRAHGESAWAEMHAPPHAAALRAVQAGTGARCATSSAHDERAHACALRTLHELLVARTASPARVASSHPNAALCMQGMRAGPGRGRGETCRRRRAWCPKMTWRGPGHASATGSPASRGNLGSARQLLPSRPTARTCAGPTARRDGGGRWRRSMARRSVARQMNNGHAAPTAMHARPALRARSPRPARQQRWMRGGSQPGS